MESNIELFSHQLSALGKLKPGSVLFGGVGTGKTLTSLSYYLANFKGKDLYVITTAKKRNSGDWEEEASSLGISELSVDSWNNIANYNTVTNAFFIFDEQRVVGYGAWVKSFLKITKSNLWILLSGTPGDTWMDYLPVFLANGFYRNKTDFIDQHVEYDRFSKFPKIKKYHNEGKLIKFRNDILVHMVMKRHTTRHRKYIAPEYDKIQYDNVMSRRWNIYEERPIRSASELTQILRRIVSVDKDREFVARFIMDVHEKIIVFYNYNYELDLLIEICERLGKPYSQWNGSKHQEIPDTDTWIYLAQYTAAAEGWNCIETDTILFYSLNYSYKQMEQSEGRIDRLNTPFFDLKYFYLSSDSSIDKAVRKAISTKKRFNESAWAKRSMT